VGAGAGGALLVRALLQELALESWLKTSGGKGLHVVVPLAPEARLRRGEGLLAGDRAAPREDDSAALRRQERRHQPGRRIFVDYLRNGHGQTTATGVLGALAAGLGVSMPVAWEQLGSSRARRSGRSRRRAST
jgi:bifunctional non-homologous end joining protein LigD